MRNRLFPTEPPRYTGYMAWRAVGDAAHTMTPFYGMGAGMAFEGAAVFARCPEADEGDWRAAFARYERVRRSIAT